MGRLNIEYENINTQLTFRAIKGKDSGCNVKLAVNLINFGYYSKIPQNLCKEQLENISHELPLGYKMKVMYKTKYGSDYKELEYSQEFPYVVASSLEDMYVVASIDKNGANKLYKEAESFAIHILHNHHELMKNIYLVFKDEKKFTIAEDGISSRQKYVLFSSLGVKNLKNAVQRYGMALALASLFTQINKKQYNADTNYTSALVELTNELLDW